MSLDDYFTFPEFLPLGLIVRPHGGIKAEPQGVKTEEDLPGRFMFGCLQKGSFRKTKGGWSASYLHPTAETSAEVFYNNVLVLLCYKKGVPQKGQPESCRSRTLAIVCRRVAMDQGLCRSTRTG